MYDISHIIFCLNFFIVFNNSYFYNLVRVINIMNDKLFLFLQPLNLYCFKDLISKIKLQLFRFSFLSLCKCYILLLFSFCFFQYFLCIYIFIKNVNIYLSIFLNIKMLNTLLLISAHYFICLGNFTTIFEDLYYLIIVI